KLNTLLARFAVATPYPGTEYYKELEKKGKLLTKDFEEYNQFNLVFAHENFSPEQIKKFLEKAYRKYYFRPSYAFTLLSSLKN
ncbi:MAG: B12-binding domain-containing radical SAM protein, partial [Nanoarchaeota archaeon]|nr:B12-binding domain-containing radical SAM protein [Nanoarchaeota archaeon]